MTMTDSTIRLHCSECSYPDMSAISMPIISKPTDPIMSQTELCQNDRHQHQRSPLSAHPPEGGHVMDISMLVPSKGLNAMRQNMARSRGLLVEHQHPHQHHHHEHPHHQQQQPQWQRQAPSQTMGVAVDKQSEWRKKMHRVKVLYAKGQYKECQTLCKQLLNEREGNHTAVSKHISTPNSGLYLLQTLAFLKARYRQEEKTRKPNSYSWLPRQSQENQTRKGAD